uniref:RanBP2-type domain-containing protein n=1 Tax=Globodera rostochiensis TaxID=31243 RepID=A0A914I8A3_GLORO
MFFLVSFVRLHPNPKQLKYKKNCRIVEAAKGKMLSAQLKQLRFLNICHRIVRLSPRGGRQMQMTLAEFLFARNFSTSTKLCSFYNLNSGWKCPDCSFRNFMERSSCRRCGHSPPKASLVSAALNVWQCSGAACFKCGIAKPAEIHSLRGEIEADGCWFCAKCGFRNKPIRDACYRCETKPTDEQQHDIIERSGIWLCSSCGNKNFRSKKECNACKMVRGSSIGIYGQSVRK